MSVGGAAPGIVVLGSFVADLTFRTPRLPEWGEAVFGSDFRVSPGGKGANQAIAIARLGGRASFVGKLGRDVFGDLARSTFARENVDTEFCFATESAGTGGAAVIVHASSGENAIVVDPGSSFRLTPTELDAAANRIKASAAFITQLEMPLEVVMRGLGIAHDAGVTTILNPAPAVDLPREVYALCDYVTPNEAEASSITGERVSGPRDAERAAATLLSWGARNVVLTLGAQGAFVKTPSATCHVPAVDAGAVVETTGAGDSFNGAFALALAEGMDAMEATRFACTAAGISVTRRGTSESMPTRGEVDALVRKAS